MPKRRHVAEQIIARLREAEVFLGEGMKMPQVCRRIRRHGADVLSLA
jgi:hypothetical protein